MFRIFGYCNKNNNGIYSPDDHDRSMGLICFSMYPLCATHILTFPLFSSTGIPHASYYKVIFIDSYVGFPGPTNLNNANSCYVKIS